MGGNKILIFMSRVLFVTLFAISSLLVTAQSTVSKSPEVERMLDVFASRNKNQETIRAWRIQIAALSDRREMENEKTRFENLYPYMPLEWEFDNPYYILKLRDAAFKEKLKALNLLHRIKRRYPSALLVLDDVKREKILKSSSI